MNKTILLSAITTLGLGITGAVISAQPANASTRYYPVKTINRNNLPYHAKTQGSAYIYNLNHTRKLHQLKNFPQTTWYVSKSLLMRSSYTGKRAVFYEVSDNSGKITGIVWRGYLTTGAASDSSTTDNPTAGNGSSGDQGTSANDNGQNSGSTTSGSSQSQTATVTGNGVTQAYLKLTGDTNDTSLQGLTSIRQAAYAQSNGNKTTTTLADDATKSGIDPTGLQEKYLVLNNSDISDLEDDNADQSVKMSDEICAAALKKQFSFSGKVGISTFVTYYGYSGDVMSVKMIILYRN
ncbi:MAG: hypothetical protein LKF37_04650 [Lentilactobacillus diolivorans]|jgi:hypothetical protein|nr:hypothetical protein [Lentilactobacillus diolivorans]RRG01958.1 MAG: hypothetical protein DUD34_10075 [Lactobacillus sp.]